MMRKIMVLCALFAVYSTTGKTQTLERISYQSEATGVSRDYFVYIPKGYQSKGDDLWPAMLFLHGNGERGDAKDELPFVLMHGPLYEAWIQKKDIPMFIISPQLPMFGLDVDGPDYLKNRDINSVPKRLMQGVPPRPAPFAITSEMTPRRAISDMSDIPVLPPRGWEQLETDLLSILTEVQQRYRINKKQLYLSGLSYGGVGSWYMASRHPSLFAAVVPVVGWGHPSLMAPIAQHQLPLWVFAGGRDNAMPLSYFYAGLDELEARGHRSVRFTVHHDMAHDAWTRVYQSDDLYQWLLRQRR